MARLIWLVPFLPLLIGCPRTAPQTGPGPQALPTEVQPELLSFSETSPYTSLAVLGDQLYAGTAQGLVRFNLKTGEFVRIAREQGLAGSSVLALCGNASSGLWVATEGGISRFHQGTWTNLRPAITQTEMVTTMAAAGDKLWTGGAKGLARQVAGQWKGFLPGARVTALLPDLDGEGVWVGTDAEGVYHLSGDKLDSHSVGQGQMLRRIKGMGFSGDGGLFVVGSEGVTDQLSFFDGKHWTAYQPEPRGRIHWVQQVGGETLLSYENRILGLHRRRPGLSKEEQAKVVEGPVKLKATLSPRAPAGYPVQGFTTRPVDRWFPPVPTVVLSHAHQVIIGTRHTGAALFDGKKVRWFRTNDLLGRSDRLRMACSGESCFVAGGDGQAYRYRGKGFEPLKVSAEAGARVQTFVRDPAGSIQAIHIAADGQTLVVSDHAGGAFSRRHEAKITVPQGRVEAHFARHDPAGKLWVLLSYVDPEGERHPWGAAVIAGGAPVIYHRSTLLPTEDRPEGSLALPDDIRDVVFAGGEIWLATGNGICRVNGKTVDLFTENEGLESEIAYAMLRTSRGSILAATYAGVGRLDGKWWRFEKEGPLGTTTRALLEQGDAIWVGSAAGLVRWSGPRQQVIDMRRGLAGDAVHDLFLENDRRLWILTDQGLSILGL